MIAASYEHLLQAKHGAETFIHFTKKCNSHKNPMGQINITMFYSQVRKASLKSLRNLLKLVCAPTGTGAQIPGINSKAPALMYYSLGSV